MFVVLVISILIYIYTHVHIYIYIHIHIYNIYIYIHTHTHPAALRQMGDAMSKLHQQGSAASRGAFQCAAPLRYIAVYSIS